MPTVLVTGGTGLVGRFIVEHFLGLGLDVIVAGRTVPSANFFSKPVKFYPFSLAPDTDYSPMLEGVGTLVHGAFDHIPGKYRGGEGRDPSSFIQKNRAGTAKLFQDAKNSRVCRAVLLSSRAVYGTPPPGTILHEDDPYEPDTLYGKVKTQNESDIASLVTDEFTPFSLRITGVYGPGAPGRSHKWTDLFARYVTGETIASRAATEVHGQDVAAAISILANAPCEAIAGRAFNVSDTIFDTRDILRPLASLLPSPPPLPSRGNAGTVSAMATNRLRALGWAPGGRALFEQTIDPLARAFIDATP